MCERDDGITTRGRQSENVVMVIYRQNEDKSALGGIGSILAVLGYLPRYT